MPPITLQETFEQTHYSVDMLLGVAITALIWRWRSGLYPADAVWAPRRPGAPADPVPLPLVGLVFGVLALVLVGTRGV